ncbi:MAG: Mur ligase family protein, partial [Chloroflexota bacterium]
MDVAAVVRGTGARVLQRGADGQLRENELHAADLSQVVGEICIDSRERTRDALFVALPGVRSDGHAFVPEVLRAGARGCLIKSEHAADLAPLLPAGELRYLFVVNDPLIALQRLAANWREAHRATIIGITGSIGKTTSKEIIAGLLATRWSVLRSIANLNTEIGLPLMLLRLAEHHHIVVLEMGMYAAGDIADLARIARPEIGVVTTVEPIHLERMGSLERIARTKSELIAALPT